MTESTTNPPFAGTSSVRSGTCTRLLSTFRKRINQKASSPAFFFASRLSVCLDTNTHTPSSTTCVVRKNYSFILISFTFSSSIDGAGGLCYFLLFSFYIHACFCSRLSVLTASKESNRIEMNRNVALGRRLYTHIDENSSPGPAWLLCFV